MHASSFGSKQEAFKTALPVPRVRPALLPAPFRRRHCIVPVAAAAAAELAPTVTEEELPGSRVRVTITIPAAAVNRSYKKTLAEYNANISCEGYRKGKAPEAVLVKKLGGQERFNNSVLSEMVQGAMQEVLGKGKHAHRAIAETEAIDQNGAELEGRFALGQDFTFSVAYDVLPELTWRTPHAQLAVTVEAVSSEELDAERLEAKMRALLKESGKMRVVADRGLRRGDVAIIDFDSYDAAGELIAGASRQGMRLDTELADDEFLPGVASAMEGMRTGEERETTMTIPADSNKFKPAGGDLFAALRGTQKKIRVKVLELFEWALPEANEEWAVSLLGAGSTPEDVKARLAENTRAESEDATRQRIADAFNEAVAAAVEVEVPDSLVMELGRNEYSRELNEALAKGSLKYEQVEQLVDPRLVRMYVDKKRAELVELQKAALGFADILSREGLALDEAAIEREVRLALDSVAQGRRGEINEDGVREQVVKSLETQAAMDWLVANCSVTVTPPAS